MGVALGGDTITDLYLGTEKLSRLYEGTNLIYSAATYSVTVTISGTLTGCTRSTTSLVIPEGESRTFTVNASSGYQFTAASQSSATESSSYISVTESFKSGVFTYTVTAASDLGDANRTATITNTATASAISYAVTGTVTATLTQCSITVDGDSSAPYNVNETRTITSGGSFTIIATPHTGYFFNANTDLSVSGLNSFTLSSRVLNSNGTITATFTYPAGASALDDDFSVTVTASSQSYPVTGTVTATLSNCSIVVDGDSAVPYDVNETRTIAAGGSFTIVATPNSNYSFSSASNMSISGLNSFTLSSTVLNSNGTITATITYPAGASSLDDDFSVTVTASAITYSGTFVKPSNPANMTYGNPSPSSWSGTVGQTVLVSVTAFANSGYRFTATRGTVYTQTYTYTIKASDNGKAVTAAIPTPGIGQWHTASYSTSHSGISGGSLNNGYTVSNRTQSSQSGFAGETWSFNQATASPQSGWAFSSGPSYSTSNLSGTFSNSVGDVSASTTITGTVYQLISVTTANIQAGISSGSISGAVNSSGADATEAGFYWLLLADGSSTPSQATMLQSGTKVVDTPSGGTGSMSVNISYSASFSEREAFAMAYGTNANGTVYGAIVTDSVPAQSISKPTVTTNAIDSVAQNSIGVNGNVSNWGGSGTGNVGFFYSTSSSFGTFNATLGTYSNATKITTHTGVGTGSFKDSIKGLSPQTTYYVAAWASNGAGYSVGSIVNATTTGDSVDISYTGTIASSGGLVCFGLTTAGPSTGSVSSNQSWLTFTNSSFASDAIVICGNAASNTGSARTATVTATKGSATDSVTVTQNAPAPATSGSLPSSILSFPADGGSGSSSVSGISPSGGEWNISATSTVNVLIIPNTGSGNNSSISVSSFFLFITPGFRSGGMTLRGGTTVGFGTYLDYQSIIQTT